MAYGKMKLKTALDLANPRTWAASLLPALFGCLYCSYKGYRLAPWQALFLVAAAILMQSAVNCFNDYFDFIKGADTQDNNLERGDAVLIYENIDPRSVNRLGLAFLGAAAAIGAALIISSSFVPLFIGLIGALAVISYSGGKNPVSYLPVGEIVSGFVMGALIPLGCAAVATGKLKPEIILYSLPFVISIGLILMSNNGCDIEKDIKAGRKTLSIIMGREKSRKLYKTLIILWVTSSIGLSLMLTGLSGLSCAVLAHLFAKKSLMSLMHAPLDQAHRIEQMKDIIRTNYLMNGSYIAALLIGILLKYAGI